MCLFYLVINVGVILFGLLLCVTMVCWCVYFITWLSIFVVILFSLPVPYWSTMICLMFYHWRLFSQLFGCQSLLELLFLLLTVILFLHELWNVLLINDLNHDRQTLLKVWESMSRYLTSILLIVQRNWRASSQVGQTWQPSQHFSQHIIYEEAKYLMSNKCKSFFFCRRGDMEL